MNVLKSKFNQLNSSAIILCSLIMFSNTVIAENLLCIVIADSILSKFGGDSINQLKIHIKNTAKY